MVNDHLFTRFGLIRHAPTIWNRDKRIQGGKDSPLTTESMILSRDWGRALARYQWDRILSSDLGRAVSTAEQINTFLQVPIVRIPLLREMDWGEWTGKTIQQIKKETPGILHQMESAGWYFRPPGGENRIMVWNRCHQALVEAARRWYGKTILVVTHEGVIKCLIYHLKERKFLPDEPPVLHPGYLHRLMYSRNRLRIEHMNALKLP